MSCGPARVCATGWRALTDAAIVIRALVPEQLALEPLWVSAAFALPPLIAATIIFNRRDVAA